MTTTALREILEETLGCLSETEAALSGLVRFASALDDSTANQFRALLLPHVSSVQMVLADLRTAHSITERLEVES